MINERENNSSINLTASQGIPTVSFAAGNAGAKLTPEPFHISGNEFTAYYDGAHRLVFVLDQTLDSRKPNVLLVINSIGDRKWDDILAADYGVDLETVRPKVDNKYQKLDIEYSGLSIYNNLINESQAGRDLTAALDDLSNFRTATVRRAAASRLDASNESITKTRETISKTGETMRELQAHLKKLREKLSRQKKEVGKEPTKQSAAKILKTEAQIEATNEKLHRAKKRLTNAQRRSIAAEEDADIARRILGQKQQKNIPAVAPTKEKVIKPTEIIEEPKAETMAKEEVKPLFDQDPEFLDEKIAFKPIDFNIPSVNVPEPMKQPERFVEQETLHTQETVTPPAPLLFTPPVIKARVDVFEEETPSEFIDDSFEPIADVPSPVLNTITSVNAPEPIVDDVVQPAPVMAPISPLVVAMPAAAPVIQPAPISSGERPVSPLSGMAAPVSDSRSKPAALYYIMLVVLIVLSVLTLWLYQRNSVETVPDLAAPAKTAVMDPAPETVVMAPQPESVNGPFIQAELNQPAEPEAVPVSVPQPVAVSDAQSMPEQIPVDMDVVVDTMVEDAPVIYDDAASGVVPMESDLAEPVYQAAEVVAAATTPVPAVPVEKPAYTVSQPDKMFVASPEYDGTDVYYDDSGYDPQTDESYTDQATDQTAEYYE